MSALLESYTEIPPVDVKCDNVPIPESSAPLQSDKDVIVRALEEEESWLKNINNIVTTQQDAGDVPLDASWAAYHSNKEDLVNRSSFFVSALLPLLPDQAKSVAMIRHSMNIIKASIDFPESRTSTCDSNGPTLIRSCKTASMEMAGYLWREEVCDHVWWPPY